MKKFVFLSFVSAFLLNACENNAGKNIVVSPNIIIGSSPSPQVSNPSASPSPSASVSSPSSFNVDEAKREIEQLTHDFVAAINAQETERYPSFFVSTSRDWEKQVKSTEEQASLGLSSVITIIAFEYASLTENTATVTIKQRYFLRSDFDGSTTPEAFGETLATYKKENGRWKFDTITARQ